MGSVCCWLYMLPCVSCVLCFLTSSISTEFTPHQLCTCALPLQLLTMLVAQSMGLFFGATVVGHIQLLLRAGAVAQFHNVLQSFSTPCPLATSRHIVMQWQLIRGWSCVQGNPKTALTFATIFMLWWVKCICEHTHLVQVPSHMASFLHVCVPFHMQLNAHSR